MASPTPTSAMTSTAIRRDTPRTPRTHTRTPRTPRAPCIHLERPARPALPTFQCHTCYPSQDDPLYVIVFPIRFVLLISLMIPISLEVTSRRTLAAPRRYLPLHRAHTSPTPRPRRPSQRPPPLRAHLPCELISGESRVQPDTLRQVDRLGHGHV